MKPAKNKIERLTINRQRDPSDPARVLARQEYRRPRDILRLAEAFEGMQ